MNQSRGIKHRHYLAELNTVELKLSPRRLAIVHIKILYDEVSYEKQQSLLRQHLCLTEAHTQNLYYGKI